MELKSLADKTAKQICVLLAVPADEAKQADVSKLIEQTLAAAVRRTTETHKDAVRAAIEPEQDMAHKIAAAMKRSEDLLVANLESLR